MLSLAEDESNRCMRVHAYVCMTLVNLFATSDTYYIHTVRYGIRIYILNSTLSHENRFRLNKATKATLSGTLLETISV